MKKIKLNFENCFGIKELKNFEIKFEDTVNKKKEVISHNVHLIYSPNGVMKSSFALIFDKYCKGNGIEICDRIHKSNISTHQIEIDDATIDGNIVVEYKTIFEKKVNNNNYNQILKRNDEYDINSFNIKSIILSDGTTYSIDGEKEDCEFKYNGFFDYYIKMIF